MISLKLNNMIGPHESSLLRLAITVYLVVCVCPRVLPDQYRSFKVLSLSTDVSRKLFYFVYVAPWLVAASIHNPVYVL